ncbi:helix-turn-helix transcriptional regulator, partial [Kitasatospora purpeofusca]
IEGKIMETKLRQDVTRIVRREARLMVAPLMKRIRTYKKELAALKAPARATRSTTAKKASATAAPPSRINHPAQISGEEAQAWYSTKNLIELREKFDLSAAGMADLVGVRPWSIYRWEAGEKPSVASMIKVASLRKISRTRALRMLEELRNSEA